jgi:hypothetical protein
MSAVTEDRALARARPLRDALYGDLVWTRPGLFRRELRLESGSELLAEIRWTKPLSFEAQAESADGLWVIGRRRHASLRPDIVMREAEGGTEIATFRRTWRRTGTLRFASGEEFSWGREGFWRPRYFWGSAAQPRLIVLGSELGWTRRFVMEVDPAARELSRLPELVLLGGYLMAVVAAESRAK